MSYKYVAQPFFKKYPTSLFSDSVCRPELDILYFRILKLLLRQLIVIIDYINMIKVAFFYV